MKIRYRSILWLLFSFTLLLIPSSLCAYQIADQELVVKTKDNTNTAIVGTITKGSDGEGGYANFNGSESYINIGTLPKIDDMTNGLHIRFKAVWNGFSSWSRIFDCGEAGSTKSSFFVANQSTSSNLYIGMHDASDTTKADTAISNVLTTGSVEEWDITISSNVNGNAVTAIDLRDENKKYVPSRTATSALVAVERPRCYIGKSLSPDRPFYGRIYYVKVETLNQKISLIDFDASKME